MMKPRLATAIAGRRSAAKVLRPYLWTAVVQVATWPGTPMDRPERRADSNGNGAPVLGSRNSRGVQPLGHISRPSMVTTWRLLAR